MQRVNAMKLKYTLLVMIILVGLYMAACSKNHTTVPEADYPKKIIGRWQGEVGTTKEKMSIKDDGTFTCQTYSLSFIANTHSQKFVTGMFYGKWNINGSMFILTITGSNNEQIMDRIDSFYINSFKMDKIELKGNNGITSFYRKRSFWYNKDERW
jgi:hypothetical protein